MPDVHRPLVLAPETSADDLKVIVADDDPLVRSVLSDVLRRDGVTVVAEAANGRDAIDLALHYRPDVLIVDLVMAGGDGVETVRRMAELPDLPTVTVVLSMSHDDDSAIEALRCGATGFLSKDVDLATLPRAIRAAAAGEVVISRRLVGVLVDRLRTTPRADLGLRPVRSALSPREWEVLDLLCEDRSTEAIAAQLVLSTETVRSHIKSILRKTGTTSRQGAVARAAELRRPTTVVPQRRVS
jgi:DNA-binding NarL/FixJ family response regulator